WLGCRGGMQQQRQQPGADRHRSGTERRYRYRQQQRDQQQLERQRLGQQQRREQQLEQRCQQQQRRGRQRPVVHARRGHVCNVQLVRDYRGKRLTQHLLVVRVRGQIRQRRARRAESSSDALARESCTGRVVSARTGGAF